MTSQEPSSLDFQKFEARKRVARFGKVILVGSGKGGVGKSLVACAMALLLADRGYRTGILDIDIHGASVPDYLEVRPPLNSTKDGLQPKECHGVRVMSVALLTGENPVPMRGGEKQDLITQFVALTDWGPLDYLVVDLPPGTGDEFLGAVELFVGKATAVLVTTPSRNAISVVSRLRKLAKIERVPVLGIILNMAYTNDRGRKTYPFGRVDRNSLEERLDSTIIAEIPLEPRVNSESLHRLLLGRNTMMSTAFRRLIENLCLEKKVKPSRSKC